MTTTYLDTEASDQIITEASDHLITEDSAAALAGHESFLIEIAESQDPISTLNLVWTEITETVQTLTTNRGRDNFWDSYSPGTASFTFNDSFLASVTITPNMPIRVSVTDSTATQRFLFTGFLRPQQGYTSEFFGGISATTIQAVDALGLIAERTTALLTTADGRKAGEMIERLNTVAYFVDPNIALFPWWEIPTIDDGATLIQDLPAGGSFLDVIQQLAFTDGGTFYVLGDGTINYDDRIAVAATARIATSQVTFDDLGAGDSTYSQHFSMWQPPIYTTASAIRANDTSLTTTDENDQTVQAAQTFTFSEAASVALYGTSAFPPVTNALMSSNAETAALAERLVRSSNTVVTAPKTIRLYPSRYTADPTDPQLDAAVQRELRDRVLWKHSTQSPSGADVWVERIQHSVDFSSKEWTCDLSFTSRDQILANVDPTLWLILDDSLDGLLNGSRKLAW